MITWISVSLLADFASCTTAPLRAGLAARGARAAALAMIILVVGIFSLKIIVLSGAAHGFNLGFERLRVEWLHDVVVHARLFGRDDVLGLRFCRHHDERVVRRFSLARTWRSNS